MNPVKREFILYLEDMLESMDRIGEYLEDLDFKNRECKRKYLAFNFYQNPKLYFFCRTPVLIALCFF